MHMFWKAARVCAYWSMCANWNEYGSSEIAPILAFIYNESLAQGTVPDDWRQANVAPMYKLFYNNVLSGISVAFWYFGAFRYLYRPTTVGFYMKSSKGSYSNKLLRLFLVTFEHYCKIWLMRP